MDVRVDLARQLVGFRRSFGFTDVDLVTLTVQMFSDGHSQDLWVVVVHGFLEFPVVRNHFSLHVGEFVGSVVERIHLEASVLVQG